MAVLTGPSDYDYPETLDLAISSAQRYVVSLPATQKRQTLPPPAVTKGVCGEISHP
ncbi:hypothetical protein FRC03_009793 [Tulasnella sp. 419]|nr:hypothetical protein FRC03_009793 [Tulasnella sp. 419]